LKILCNNTIDLFLISVGYETLCINNYVEQLSVKTGKKVKDEVFCCDYLLPSSVCNKIILGICIFYIYLPGFSHHIWQCFMLFLSQLKERVQIMKCRN